MMLLLKLSPFVTVAWELYGVAFWLAVLCHRWPPKTLRKWMPVQQQLQEERLIEKPPAQ
jgi:hypothetical protein